MKRVIAEIFLREYKKNIEKLRKIVSPKTKLMLVVKANAYGHGAIEIAKTAQEEKVDYLGVAWLSEAMELREHGIELPILLLSEPIQDYTTEIVKNDITQTIYTKKFADLLAKKAKDLNKKIRVHLKVDTGMGRIGCKPEETLSLVQYIKSMPNLILEGIFTHFANADNPKSDYTNKQLELFKEIISQLENKGFVIPIKHAANSDAVVNFSETHLDMVRVGLFSYTDVLTLKSYVGYLKEVPPQTYLSYGSQYCTKKKAKIATIMIGYADGVPKALENIGAVLIKGKRFQISGRICMDMLMVDLDDNASNIAVGDEVVIIGKQESEYISINEICKLTNKIPYEIMCGITSKRIFKVILD